jgi:hypothetical protein
MLLSTLRCLVACSLALMACGKVGSDDEMPDAARDAPREQEDSGRDAGGHFADAPVSVHDAGLPDGACRSNADCPQSGNFAFTTCAGPAGAGGCVCEELPSCTDDSQCDAGAFCTSDAGVPACHGPGSFCFPECHSARDCQYWQACTGGRCVAMPCDQCPSYLSCGSGACAPKSCAGDGDCPGGYCVDSTCSGTLGTCVPECV